jgi:hypothetical protein
MRGKYIMESSQRRCCMSKEAAAAVAAAVAEEEQAELEAEDTERGGTRGQSEAAQ